MRQRFSEKKKPDKSFARLHAARKGHRRDAIRRGEILDLEK